MEIFVIYSVGSGYYSSEKVIYVGGSEDNAKGLYLNRYNPDREAVRCEVWKNGEYLTDRHWSKNA